MKHQPTLLLLGALFCSNVMTHAQDAPLSEYDSINTAVTDSVTYSQENNQFFEHLWFEGKIYQSRSIK